MLPGIYVSLGCKYGWLRNGLWPGLIVANGGCIRCRVIPWHELDPWRGPIAIIQFEKPDVTFVDKHTKKDICAGIVLWNFASIWCFPQWILKICHIWCFFINILAFSTYLHLPLQSIFKQYGKIRITLNKIYERRYPSKKLQVCCV